MGNVKTPNFKTHCPYVVSTRTNTRKSHHYTEKSALASVALESKGTRLLWGMHRGDWKLLATFVGGVRQLEKPNAPKSGSADASAQAKA